MNKYIKKIGKIVEKVPILHKVKPNVLKLYNLIEQKRKKRLIKKKGLSVLYEFDRILTTHNVTYSLVFGTLLGAVREKGFIKHDLDIDVGIWYDNDYKKIENVLTHAGFKLIRRAETDNGEFSREDTYMKSGVQIDIFYFYPFNEDTDSTLNAYTTVYVPFSDCSTMKESIEVKGGAMPIQLILPYSSEVDRIPFESLLLPAIRNRLDFVEARYGKNWRVPDPTFVYPKMGDVKCRFRSDKITRIIF